MGKPIATTELSDTCLRRFLDLRKAGRLFYDETQAETVSDRGCIVSTMNISTYNFC